MAKKKKKAEVHASEELARSLGMTGKMPHPEEAVDRPDEGAPLELDKDGALVGRKKLKPVRAHRDEDDDGSAQATSTPKRNGPKKAALPPKLTVLRPDDPPKPEVEDTTPERFGEECAVERGVFQFGEEKTEVGLPAFHIDTYPVTNQQYEVFVRATGHRPPLYWPNGRLDEELYDHPVVGVDYFDALAYARWKGKDLPYEDEWERAARGTDGRTFPWGDETDLNAANTARSGLKTTLPVDVSDDNVSPVGCRDMVGNCWELTHSPAPGGGVVVRGGSWYDFALYAKTWFRFAARPDARNGTIGFRCVRREEPREAPREVDPSQIDAEIMARTGPQPPVDESAFSPEKRDLCPDLRRLREMREDLEDERRARAERAGQPDRSVTISPPKRQETAPVEEAPAPEPQPEPAFVAPEPEPAPEPTFAPEPEREAGLDPFAFMDEADAKLADDDSDRDELDPGAVTRAAERAAVETRVAETEETEWAELLRRTPLSMWALLGVGFLLVGALVVVLVNRAGSPDPQPVKPETQPAITVDNPLEDLPALPPHDDTDDIRPFEVVDGDEPGATMILGDGSWLLVFVDPRTDAGKQTMRAAHNIALRLGATGVEVGLIMPREQIADDDGTLPGTLEVEHRVKEHWRDLNGLTVVLDNGILRKAYVSSESVAAVVLYEGNIEMLTLPPGNAGFTVHTLGRIASQAVDMSPHRVDDD